jgi:cytochrome c556
LGVLTRMTGTKMTGARVTRLGRVVIAAALAMLIGMSYVPSAAAHKGATGVVMHRMEMMKALAAVMKEMAAMLKGLKRYDPARIKVHAETIRKHAADLPKMFPKGSNPKPSDALPVIWQDWNGFLARRRAMDVAAGALAAAALADVAMDKRSRVLRAYIGVAKTCTGCHTTFRKRK